MEIKLQTNFSEFEKAIAHVPTDARRQFVFGLTKIASEVKTAARLDFSRNYIQRTPYMVNSIVSTRADSATLTAHVGTINEKMAQHLMGGEVLQNIALSGIRGSDKRGRVTKKKTMTAINTDMERQGKSKRFFVGKAKSGAPIVFAKTGTPTARQRKRAGNTGRVIPRGPITPMWVLRGGTPHAVKPDWRLETIASSVIGTIAPNILAKVIEDAWNHAVEKGRAIG